ncbi:hypothetical protein FOA52_006029 [Chlamydomonas sp. UWO 241]|nr:hypothetical protein FOA52_006029 [Chlamydomonas sp. UWO 241]
MQPKTGRLAMNIVEPMRSLIKSQTLHTCTLDRSSNAALVVLTLVLVKKSGDATALPQAALSAPATALEPAPARSAPAPASAMGPSSAGPAHPAHPQQTAHGPSVRKLADLLQPGTSGDGDAQALAGRGSLLEELEGDGTAGYVLLRGKQLAIFFKG